MNFKLLASLLAAGMIAAPVYAIDTDPEPPEEPVAGNPGNAKPVGNSPWDGITGNSGNNNPGPGAAPMDGQRSDNPFAQPGGKGDGPSNANQD